VEDNQMKTILVATDFSPRSDRALRRAILIARRQGATLVLAHVIDDDRQERLVTSQRIAAQDLLDEITASVRREDGVECAARLAFGAPDEAIIAAGVEAGADLIIMGPHRRQSLKDIFVGTTVERVIRKSPLPVLMTVAPPTEAYARAMVAVDLSENAAAAFEAIRRLELAKGSPTGVVHVFEAPAQGLMLRASTTSDQLREYIAGQRARASADLDAFMERAGVRPDFRLIELADDTPAETIVKCAARKNADLLVIGTRGRTGLSRLVLGSVAEGVLRRSQIDVLTVSLPLSATTA
jgi:nucleotide-binding universal stress UspA family protein